MFEQIFHILRDCNQILFSNQRLNLNLDTLSSLIAIIPLVQRALAQLRLPFERIFSIPSLFSCEVIYLCR